MNLSIGFKWGQNMSYEYHSFRSFSETDFDAFKRGIFSTIEKEINSNSDDYILNVNEDEYIKNVIMSRFSLNPKRKAG